MRRAKRQLTRAELASITSRRPVVRRIPAPGRPDQPRPSVSKSASCSHNTMQTPIELVEHLALSDRPQAAQSEEAFNCVRNAYSEDRRSRDKKGGC